MFCVSFEAYQKSAVVKREIKSSITERNILGSGGLSLLHEDSCGGILFDCHAKRREQPKEDQGRPSWRSAIGNLKFLFLPFEESPRIRLFFWFAFVK